MVTLFFAAELPQTEEVSACDHERFGRFHRAMLNEGIYLPPSGYEAWSVSAAHTTRRSTPLLLLREKPSRMSDQTPNEAPRPSLKRKRRPYIAVLGIRVRA